MVTINNQKHGSVVLMILKRLHIQILQFPPMAFACLVGGFFHTKNVYMT